MNKRFFLIDLILWMLSGIYALVVRSRNWLFDRGFLQSKSFDFPVISVGNLTVGGTGKTPHTEYILSLLGQSMKVAALSRGYKRKTSGFVLADAHGNHIVFLPQRPLQQVIITKSMVRGRGMESGGDTLSMRKEI